MHCGHLYGLTPPREYPIDNYQLEKAFEWQKNTWEWFQSEIKAIGKVDRLIVNGDAIDGKGYRSGATELISADRNIQVDIAKQVIESIPARRLTIVRGTPSHTGEEEDWEDTLAERLGVKAEDHAWLEFGPVCMDIKHHIGSSTVPRSSPPALSRESVWNLLWAEKDLQPKANFIIRSHLHKHFAIGDEDFTAVVTPALQGWTKYGAKRMSKTITYGFLSFEISDNGGFVWRKHILVPRFAKALAEPM